MKYLDFSLNRDGPRVLNLMFKIFSQTFSTLHLKGGDRIMSCCEDGNFQFMHEAPYFGRRNSILTSEPLKE